MEAEKQTLIRFYKITSELGNMIYTGSTKKTIDKRFDGHIDNYTAWKKGTSHCVTSFDLFDTYGFDNCDITEISSKICNKQERDETEASYILQFRQDTNLNCVNKFVPGQTRQQYLYDNKDKIKQQKRQKCVCIHCGMKYPVGAKKRHEQAKKHIKFVIKINITNNITGNDATINIHQQKTELDLLEDELNAV